MKTYSLSINLIFILLFFSGCNPATQINKINSPITLFSRSITIKYVKAGNTNAVISWEGSSGAKTYTVKYGTTSGVYPTMVSTNATSPLTITGLTNGSSYFILVSETTTK